MSNRISNPSAGERGGLLRQTALSGVLVLLLSSVGCGSDGNAPSSEEQIRARVAAGRAEREAQQEQAKRQVFGALASFDAHNYQLPAEVPTIKVGETVGLAYSASLLSAITDQAPVVEVGNYADSRWIKGIRRIGGLGVQDAETGAFLSERGKKTSCVSLPVQVGVSATAKVVTIDSNLAHQAMVTFDRNELRICNTTDLPIFEGYGEIFTQIYNAE